MIFEELEIDKKFTFNDNNKDIYVITNFNNKTVGYRELTGTHTFAAFCVTDVFLKRTKVFELMHHPV